MAGRQAGRDAAVLVDPRRIPEPRTPAAAVWIPSLRLRYGAAMSYTTVLVGTDGSGSAMKAVARAADVAGARNASLIVVCAYHPMSAREQALITPATGDATARVTGTAAAQGALDRGVEHAREAGAPQVEGRNAVTPAWFTRGASYLHTAVRPPCAAGGPHVHVPVICGVTPGRP